MKKSKENERKNRNKISVGSALGTKFFVDCAYVSSSIEIVGENDGKTGEKTRMK